MKDNSITLQVTVKTPQVPNFVEIQNVRHANLDDAIGAGGKGLVIDVADLDKEAIERLGRQWTDALLANAEARRNRPKDGRNYA